MNRSEIKNQITKKLGKDGSAFLVTNNFQGNISEFDLKSVKSNTVVINGFCDALIESIPFRASWSEKESGDIELFGIANSDRDEPKKTVESHIRNSKISLHLMHDCHWDITKIDLLRERLLSSAKNLSQPISGKTPKTPEKSDKSKAGDVVDSALSEIGVDVVTPQNNMTQSSSKESVLTEPLVKIDAYTVSVAKSVDNLCEIRVACSRTKSENQKQFLIYEHVSGEDEGLENGKAVFSVKGIQTSKTRIIELIEGFGNGRYENIEAIATKIATIPNTGIVARVRDEGMAFGEFWKEFCEWAYRAVCSNDSRVALYEQKGIKRFAIVQRGERDLMKELYSVFREIAPDNSPKKLKDEMRRQNLFETNLPNGRTQKQVGATLQDMIGIVNNKIFEIKLPEEVLDKMMEEKSYWDEVLDDSFDEFFVNEFDEWEEI